MLLDFCQKYFPVTIDSLQIDWNSIKKSIAKLIVKEEYEKAILLIEKACYFAYSYNFVKNFFDEDIELFIHQISEQILEKNVSLNTNENSILFFDFFVSENRGFTQQYLDVFISEGKRIIYVISEKEKYSTDNKIISSINKYQNGEIVVLESINRCDKIRELFNLVSYCKPSKIFFHTSPWEVVSCCLAAKLNNTLVKSYLINITDHAFWPGITCFEFVIDFRSYGNNINKLLKHKQEENLILIQTPAYIDKEITFKGFPKVPKNSVIGFSGGSYYKIKDKQNTFLNLIKQLIEKYDQFVFFFANIGGENELINFISENKLENRFILIGNRDDISEVFSNIDIYFNTYPYGGGLMLHYALQHKKPIVSLWDSGLYHTRIDTVFDYPMPNEYIPRNNNEFIKLACRLIEDKNYRINFVDYINFYSNINKNFKQKLGNLLNNIPFESKSSFPFEVDQNSIRQHHFNFEFHYWSYILFMFSILPKKYLIPRILYKFYLVMN